jgi:hypothetical protein
MITYNMSNRVRKYVHDFRALVNWLCAVKENTRALINDDQSQIKH